MTLLAPGLWLQRLTTREPSHDQVEVSIRALAASASSVEEAETPRRSALESTRRGHGLSGPPSDAADRPRGRRRWEGTSPAGRERQRRSSGAFAALPVTLAVARRRPRREDEPGGASRRRPRGCFVTSLGGELARAGTPPERLDVRCTITMDEVEGMGHRIVSSAIAGARDRARMRRGGIRPGRRGRRRRAAPFSALIRGSAVAVSRPSASTTDARGRRLNGDRAHRERDLAGLADGGQRDDREVGSGAFGPLDVTWASRAEEPEGRPAPRS